MEKPVIAVDAMGGDHAPGEIVKGAVEAVNAFGSRIVLVGRQEDIRSELQKYSYPQDHITIENASEVISTDESPTTAIRRKKDSSMVVGLNLVKQGQAAAFVSAGSTGALLTGATVIIGRIKGIERPALGTMLPTTKGYTFLLDSGANVDCKPAYLVQFAKMATIYVEHVVGKKAPKVGLVNIGSEKEKGDTLSKEAHELLEEVSEINFVGNTEPRDIPYGPVDIVVCDGFVGNVILKLAEGLSQALFGALKEEITKGPYVLAAAALRKPFGKLKRRFDSDEVGGAPFLGLKALVVKAHGSSKAKAIKNAIKQCETFVENDIVLKIQDQL
ncbi:MAG TPA: phosphate acyltransferase PlsX [Firmicutes bacterium]|nr:phosphate acyltransferase PlsX [Bacillota bacterium]